MSQKKIKKVIKPLEYHPQAVRHVKDIDFSKADPDCKRCDGSGITGAINPNEAMQKGGVNEPVPIVCKCVTERGGVLAHPLEGVMTNLRKELKSGQWAREQLKDLRVMGDGNKQRALASMRRMIQNDDSDPLWKEEARKVLETIENEGVVN